MSRRTRALVPVLVFTTASVALISAVGAPLIPSIARDMHVSLDSAQWTLTVTVLVGAVCAPIMGRLGDGPRRREAMILGLTATVLGCVTAALAGSLGILIIGRALQGVGLGLLPLTMSAARDHLPRAQARSVIALLSVCVTAGGAVGFPVSGLLDQTFGLSAAYWVAAAISAGALICVVVVLPESTHRKAAKLDFLGALLLACGLSALLLAIAEGNSWGWRSPATISLFAGSAATLLIWVFQQLRTNHPLVELRLLNRPAVLTAHVCAMVQGTAMYMFLSAVSEFVQTPVTSGYGFGSAPLVAGLCLVPLSMTSIAVSRTLPWLTARIGDRALLPLGSLVVAAAGVFFALTHAHLWEALVMMAVLGVGLGLTNAAIPGLIVHAVPEKETGSALGFNLVVRNVGFALGSAMTGMILASHTPLGGALPTISGYTVVLWIATGICVVAAALTWSLHGAMDRPTERTPEDQRFAMENAELGPLGAIALPEDAGRWARREA